MSTSDFDLFREAFKTYTPLPCHRPFASAVNEHQDNEECKIAKKAL
jgi:hypothetical protein